MCCPIFGHGAMKCCCRQFQNDQSQRVIFLLDCGRMMTNERDGYSLLDHALNSTLMMAYVALSQGDAVGMLCFSDKIHSYIPPRGGSSQMNRLIQAGFDQFPRLVESRYDQAFLYLSTHCKRRSLVVLATNVIDEVNANAIVDYLGNIIAEGDIDPSLGNTEKHNISQLTAGAYVILLEQNGHKTHLKFIKI